MTTPENRAPKVSLFGAPVVFEDDTGSWVPGYVAGHPSTGRILVRSYDGREDRVLLVSDDDVTWRRADGTIPFEPTTPADDPIGPALPAAVAVTKSLGQVAFEAFTRNGHHWQSADYPSWERTAQAVIAAHEAGREMERVVRWAVRLAPGWFGSNFCNANKSERTLFNLREHAEVIAQSFTGARIVPVPTRRRRVVKS